MLRSVVHGRVAWFGTRYASLIVVACTLIPVTLFQPYKNTPAIRADGVGYHLWTYAILTGRPNFDWYQGDPEFAGLNRVEGPTPVWANKYPPGVALIRLPFVWPFVELDPLPGGFSLAEDKVILILGAITLLATLGLMLNCCRRLGVSNVVCHIALLTLTFGTGLFHYSTYDACFSHVYTALGVAILAWITVRAAEREGGRFPFLATVLTVALMILIRNTNVFFLLVWAGYAAGSWASRERTLVIWGWLPNAIAIAGGMCLGAGSQLALNSMVQGRWTLSSYGSESFLWDRPMMRSVLLSYERGLFSYYPVLALVLILGLWVRRTRGATLAFIAVVLVYAALYGYWHSWMLGGGFGHRGFVDFVPAAIPIFAVGLNSLNLRCRRGLFALAAVCVFASLSWMGSYWCGDLPISATSAEMYWQQSYRIDNVLWMWFHSHWN